MSLRPEAGGGDFSRLLRRFRVRSKLTQGQLAKQLGYRDGSWVSRYESRNQPLAPTREQVLQFAGALSLSPLDETALLGAAGYQANEPEAVLLSRLTREVAEMRGVIEGLVRGLDQSSTFLPTPLPEFAGEPKVLWMAGTTLYSLPLRFAGYLRTLLEHATTIRLVICHPEVMIDPVLAPHIEGRRGFEHLSFGDELNKSLRLFQSIAPRARIPDQFQVWGYKSIQYSGLTIVEPETPAARVRISTYLSHYPLAFNPVNDYSAAIPAQGQVVHAVEQHFLALVEASNRLV